MLLAEPVATVTSYIGIANYEIEKVPFAMLFSFCIVDD